MKDWNLKQLVSIEVESITTLMFPELIFTEEVQDEFGRIAYRKGFYKTELLPYIDYKRRFIEDSYTENCPEGYRLEDGKVFKDEHKVILKFTDGSSKEIDVKSVEESLKLKEEIIKQCSEDFKKLKL